MAAIDHAQTAGESIVFIIASPRSGTTLLGEVLGRHSQIAEWYEPYFVWDWECGFGEDDIRGADVATPTSRARLIAEFSRIKDKANAAIVVEKLPEHAFQIPYLNAVFPKARYIHLVRDGRDVVHSIHREWIKRQRIAGGEKLREFVSLTWSMLRRQALWRHRLMAILFELRARSFSSASLLNKAKWANGGGWGPRFKGWRRVFESEPLLSFNAHQWRACEQQIKSDLAIIPKDRTLNLRYEDFVQSPNEELERVMTFLNLPVEPQISQGIDPGRRQQWRAAFTDIECEQVAAVIQAELQTNGYVNDDPWWQTR